MPSLDCHAQTTRFPVLFLDAQVADGHHRHHVSELVCEQLPAVLGEAVAQHATLEAALVGAAFPLPLAGMLAKQ
jgi:hypothetical protein